MRIKVIFFIHILFVAVFGISCDRELIRSGFPIVITVSAEDMENYVAFTGQLQKYDKEIDEAGFIWQCNADPVASRGFKIAVPDPGSEQFRAEAAFTFGSENDYSVRAYARCGETMIFGERIDFHTNQTLHCQLLRIEPESAYRGDTINLIGKGFNMILQYNKVLIEGRNSRIINGNDTVLTCIVPYETTKGSKSVRIAVNGVEKDFGPMFTLLLPPPPQAITGEPGNVTAVSATVSGSVNPNNLLCTIVFEYGLTTSYGQSITAYPGTAEGDIVTTVTAVLNNLSPVSTYHYRIKAVSESGSGVGDDFTFTTPELPPEPNIQSLSASNVKYGKTLNITGYNFSQVSQVLLGSPSQYIVVNPKSSSETAIEIEVYNHQNPTQLLGFSVFRVGLVYAGGIKWSDPVNIISGWTRLTDLPSSHRYKAGCFSIAGKIYIGGGSYYSTVFKDLWRYDPSINTWSAMADLPGVGRIYPASAAGSGYGFMGTGFSADNSTKYQLYDFYRYNPASNTWSAIPDYPDNISNFFIGFAASINERTFFSLSNTVQTMREIVNNNWVSRNAPPELMDNTGTGVFTIGNSFYVICGFNMDGTTSREVWEYSSITDSWTRKADFPGNARHVPVCFSIGSYGYYGCGRGWYEEVQYRDIWRYDPDNDKWIRIEDFPGGNRSHTVSASDGSNGYAGLGYFGGSYYRDFWKYNPE